MAFVSADLNQRSVLALVAADLSYAVEGSLVVDQSPLSTLQDSNPEANFFPISLAMQAAINARETQIGDKKEVALGDWVLKADIYDGTTGFSSVFFYSEERNEYIVALTGTNGLDGQDWYNNLNLSTTQWSESNQASFGDIVASLRDRNPAFSNAHVTFTGQSLGGALAQFAAYEFTEALPEFNRTQMSVITFNGLGAFGGMPFLYADFDPNRLANSETAHYVVQNDIVHRLGDGNFNAAGNTYLLDFHALPGQDRTLGLVEAHRIESGFYRGFDWANVSAVARDLGWGSFQTAAVPYAVDYLKLTEGLKLAAGFAQLFNDNDHSPFESWARLIAGVTHGLRTMPVSDLHETSSAFLEHIRRASANHDSTAFWAAAKVVVPLALKAAAGSQAGVAASAFGIFAGIGWDISEEAAGFDAGMRERLERLLPPGLYNLDLARSIADEPDFAHSMFKALIGLKIADGSILKGIELQYDADQVLSSAFVESDWLKSSLQFLAERARDTGVSLPQVSMAMAQEAILLAKKLGGSTGTLLDQVRSDITEFAADIGQAIANAHEDLVTKVVDTVFHLQQAIGFTDSRSLVNDLRQRLEQPLDVDVEEAFGAALELIESAAQTVVVRSDRAGNPFDDPFFDPNAAAMAMGQLAEGGASTFTAYLPYEAGVGGQKIRILLAGGIADKFTLFGTEEAEISVDGTFTLTVAEGQREISFAIAALEDVDDDAAFTLSAQLVALVDGLEVATHLERKELELAVDAVDETPPAGGMEYHGDWGFKLFPVFTSDGTPLVDENGNQLLRPRMDERYPPFTNLERDPNGAYEGFEQGHSITGLDGDDHIWLGEFAGSGTAIGLGGDDHFEGMANVPNLIIGDYSQGLAGPAGNDTIEGGENLQPYSDPGFTRENEHIEGIGDDILFGGPGDDAIYADRIALLGETLDPDMPALDQKGDWITGEQGDDRIFGSAAHDVLFGGGGADEIHGGAGNDVLDGDDNYSNWGDAWWEVDPGFFGVTFFPVTNVRESWFEYYKDFGGDDVLDGGAGDDLVFGMLGNDTLIGGSGKDRLEGWEGDDQLFGGAGDDVLAGDFGRFESPWLRQSGANLRVMPGAVGRFVGDASTVEQLGNDFLDGGAGNDQLLGEAGDDTLLGRDGDDVLVGDAGYLPEELHGNDVLDGGGGADRLSGNAGDDRLFGGADNDSLSGDAGNDQADGGSGDDRVSGGEGDDVLKGSEGLDTLAGDAGSDVLEGGGGNDQLSGGEGDDVLRGDAGADSLEGGAGADSLYGGSGEDVLSGGDGNDLIDGGAGIDLVRGGAGDDTYVFGLGYGEDLIEDGEGSNRLRFGAGIAPEDLSAALDVGTLSATIVFGAGDSATLNVSAFQVGGVDFAGGTSWGREQFLAFMPALVSAGSDSAEALAGNENVRNELRGLGGDDILIGSANADLLDGGAGADSLDGGAGSDLYVFAATDSDTDTLADSELQARAYLDWYYANLGIADWIERGQHAGKYKAAVAGWITEYYDSFDDAFAALPTAEISLVAALPSVAPLVRRDDQAALEELMAAGILSRDVVEFGPGLALSDLTLSVTVNAAEAADHPEQRWYSGGTLAVAWGSGGFDLEVPGISYGFAGSNLLIDGSGPDSDVPGAWRGYRLGEGIEQFRFADGTTYSLEELLRQAAVIEVVGDYQLSRDSGPQLVSRHYGSIAFEADIRSSEISISRDGTDLLITVDAGGAQARVVGWYDDPEFMPSLSLRFAADPEIDAATLTQMGLEMVGSEDDEVIAGLDGFDDVLAGGAGSDILDGGTGKDTYLFNRGDGSDTITDAPSAADGADASIVVLGAGIDADDVQLRLGSLVLDFGEGDEIHFSAFDAANPHASPVFERLEFDDGSSMSYEEVLDLGFSFTGTDGDDVILGTGATDFMDAGAGNDTLAAGPGDDDQMAGGLGSDTYLFAPGDGYYDMIVESDENPGDVDTLRLTGGILPADVRVTRDQWSYWLVVGDGDLLVIDSMAVEPGAVVEHIEFDDGTVWTPDDLAARVDLLPGTDLGDALWGTAGNDTLEGLGGDDQLFGNAGDDVLVGGEGSDLYYFATGDGADVVDNYDTDASFDTIYFADASSTDANLAKSGNDLVIRIGEGADRVTLSGWYGGAGPKVDEVVFVGDFVGWDAATLEQLAPAGVANNAPEVANPLANQAALEDEEFSFSIPQGSFGDADADELAYSATLLDGAELPAWLSFDPELQRFSGTPANADVAALEITVTATDPAGEAASDSFALEVINTNDAPVVAGVIADMQVREGEALAFSLSPGVFSDPDANDHLSLSAAMANGSALPGWLSFDGTSFRGTPGLSDAGEYAIEVTARDDADATAETSFRVTVEDNSAAQTLVGTRHKDVLRGGAADEVLVGLGGNDELRGGKGDDVYVHGGRDGHDEIVEAGGDFDVIRFGEGITGEMVRAKRHHDDLVLDVSGPHGSVTVTGWFASKARRVEFVQFANGTVWDEGIIRRLVRKGDAHEGHHHHQHADRDRDETPSSRRTDQGRQAGIDWYRSRDAIEALISERLSAGTSFDFEALARPTASRPAALDPQEIARQWARAHSYASGLAFEADDSAAPGWQSAASKLADTSAAGFGFEASIGVTRPEAGLRALEGLTEGFRKL